MHHASCANVEMADFAIAHLPVGQADGGTGSEHQSIGKFIQQRIVGRLTRQSDRVAFGLGAVAPTIEHGEDDRLRSAEHNE